MDIRTIDAGLSVSPQISPADLLEIAGAGFRSIICNRPDGEGSDQPGFEEIEAAAKEAGLETRYLPIRSGMVRDEDATAFGAALRDLPTPLWVEEGLATGIETAMGHRQHPLGSVEDIAGLDLGRCRRVFYNQEDFLELHLNILRGVSARYKAPFFTALKEYSRQPTGVFHAMPISRGNSVFKSHWIQDMGHFTGATSFWPKRRQPPAASTRCCNRPAHSKKRRRWPPALLERSKPFL